jgi:hypothetical protein
MENVIENRSFSEQIIAKTRIQQAQKATIYIAFQKSSRTAREQNLCRQSLQILRIGSCYKLRDLFVVLNRVEGLTPVNLGTLLKWLQRNGQNEVVAGKVFDLEELAGHDAREAALVWVVRTVGAMHREQPGAAWPKVELVDGVFEAVRPPPAGDPRWVSHCGEHLRRACTYEDAS